MFGLVNFRTNRVLQNTLDETGGILQMMKQLPGCEEAGDSTVDIT
jgi:hypothetical protein